MNTDVLGSIDLHTHTIVSDGTLQPRELVGLAYQSGLAAVAVTDHDTVDGLPEALSEGKNIGLKVIPGVEISVRFQGELHLLGYFSETSFTEIEAELKILRKHREERNPLILERLHTIGIDISMENVEKESAGQIIGRLHIARALVAAKYVKDIDEAFQRYLSIGMSAYVGKEKLSPEDGMRLIADCGGVPVLAHPCLTFDTLPAAADFVHEYKHLGLRGIEAYYPGNSGEQTTFYIDLARENGLLVTGGTDFHGSNRKGIELGVGGGGFFVPGSLLIDLEKAIESIGKGY